MVPLKFGQIMEFYHQWKNPKNDESYFSICQFSRQLGASHFNLAGTINYLSWFSSHHTRSLRRLPQMVRYTDFIHCLTFDACRADNDRMVDPIRQLLVSIRFCRSFGSDRLAFNICTPGSDSQSVEIRQKGQGNSTLGSDQLDSNGGVEFEGWYYFNLHNQLDFLMRLFAIIETCSADSLIYLNS